MQDMFKSLFHNIYFPCANVESSYFLSQKLAKYCQFAQRLLNPQLFILGMLYGKDKLVNISYVYSMTKTLGATIKSC